MTQLLSCMQEDFRCCTRMESEILVGVWGKVQKSCPMLSRDLLYSVTVRSDGMEATEQLRRSWGNDSC